MAKAQANQMECPGACRLRAECIKISGRSNVFNATSRKYGQDELVLVSKTPVHPGTCLIVRMLDLPASKHLTHTGFLRTAAIAEVQYVQEVMEEDGLAYEMVVKYLYTD
jgi:hypothetical protein